MIFNMTGGMPLNFKLEAYSSELLFPATAKENTIGIITGTPITGYEFSSTEPASPIEGYVWITLSSYSDVGFSATKKNPIMVYPAQAKQYINGAWVDVVAKTYQDGVWVDWTRWLFNRGNQFESVTGGWNGSASINASGIMVFGTSGKMCTGNKIDRGDATKIKVNILSMSGGGNGVGNLTVVVTRVASSASSGYVLTSGVFSSAVEGTLNIGSVTEPGYIFLYTYGSASAQVDKIWLE